MVDLTVEREWGVRARQSSRGTVGKVRTGDEGFRMFKNEVCVVPPHAPDRRYKRQIIDLRL